MYVPKNVPFIFILIPVTGVFGGFKNGGNAYSFNAVTNSSDVF
jgi:hypothetical protein